jgi:hypothetical protein
MSGRRVLDRRLADIIVALVSSPLAMVAVNSERGQPVGAPPALRQGRGSVTWFGPTL